MALPTTLDPTAPLGTAGANLGDDQLRALKQMIVDFFGVPADPTSLTTAAFSITAAGIVSLVADAPATPAANAIYRDSIVKAWCYFTTAAGVVTLQDDVNVSSITDNAAGDFTVVFATTFGNANYALSGNIGPFAADDTGVIGIQTSANKLTGSCRIITRTTKATAANFDFEMNTAIFIGDQ